MRYLAFNRWLASVCMVFPQNVAGKPCRHLDLREDWCAHCGFCPVQMIVYEQTVPGIGGIAREIAAGFATRVQEFCAIHSIEHTAVYPSTLKKWTTGKGNADKAAMLEAVARRFGRRVDDHNEADAVALLHYALSELVPGGVVAERPEFVR